MKNASSSGIVSMVQKPCQGANEPLWPGRAIYAMQLLMLHRFHPMYEAVEEGTRCAPTSTWRDIY